MEESRLMYVAKHDPAARLAFWRFHGRATTSEWTRHLADMDVVATWSIGSPRACVLVEANDFEWTAKQRAEFVVHSSQPGYRPLVALVTTSEVVRGMLRAITWMQPSRAYEIECFADVPSATLWLESNGRRSLSRLRRLHSQAREDCVGESQ